MQEEMSKLSFAIKLLSPRVAAAVTAIPETERKRINEIRLRLSKPLMCTLFSKEYYVTPYGKLTNAHDEGLIIHSEDIAKTYETAFEYSLHSYHKEITQGYITTEGGNRLGFCGTAVLSNDRQARVENVKYISSINLRIAREVIGCAKELFNELSNTKNGLPNNNIGDKCDVFCGYTKYDAIMTAVKVMTPQIIICDEIGSEDDLWALRYAVNSGVRLIVTAHSGSIDELKKRPVVSKLIKDKCFDYAVILGSGAACGTVKSICRL